MARSCGARVRWPKSWQDRARPDLAGVIALGGDSAQLGREADALGKSCTPRQLCEVNAIRGEQSRQRSPCYNDPQKACCRQSHTGHDTISAHLPQEVSREEVEGGARAALTCQLRVGNVSTVAPPIGRSIPPLMEAKALVSGRVVEEESGDAARRRIAGGREVTVDEGRRGAISVA